MPPGERIRSRRRLLSLSGWAAMKDQRFRGCSGERCDREPTQKRTGSSLTVIFAEIFVQLFNRNL
jgi:hypothetical protein